MEEIKLASGDNFAASAEKNNKFKLFVNSQNGEGLADLVKGEVVENQTQPSTADKSKSITINDVKAIDENEITLKQRIAQCKEIIASLKLELDEEKMKSKEGRAIHPETIEHGSKLPVTYNNEQPIQTKNDLFLSNIYSASVDSKLNCDENLLEYEKQLHRYQNTLNMAQIEKKNAIRKQMLAKAFKLKLLEVENQCNIELLRIKQSLQCLEPLKLIMEKWKTNNNDNIYDINNFELIPRYPELGTQSGSDISGNSNVDDTDTKVLT